MQSVWVPVISVVMVVSIVIVNAKAKPFAATPPPMVDGPAQWGGFGWDRARRRWPQVGVARRGRRHSLFSRRAHAVWKSIGTPVPSGHLVRGMSPLFPI